MSYQLKLCNRSAIMGWKPGIDPKEFGFAPSYVVLDDGTEINISRLADRDDVAKLFAASPDLLMVARAFVAHYPMGINPHLDDAYRAARKVIAQVSE